MVCKTWLTIAAGCVDSGLSPWAGCGTDAATAKRTGTSMIWTILRLAGAAVLVLLIVALLAIVIVPRFLDRVYYRGPVSDHFDGARFFNPEGDDTLAPPAGRSRGGFLLRYLFGRDERPARSEEHTSELQSLRRKSYA